MSSEDLVRALPRERPEQLTAPPDGQTLEGLIGDLQSSYGVPQYPQEYRITIKVADAGRNDRPAEPADRPAEPTEGDAAARGDGDQPRREKASGPAREKAPSPARMAAGEEGEPKRRRRRGRRRRGGRADGPGTSGTDPAGPPPAAGAPE